MAREKSRKRRKEVSVRVSNARMAMASSSSVNGVNRSASSSSANGANRSAELMDKDPTVKDLAVMMKHFDRSDEAMEAIRSLHNIPIEILKLFMIDKGMAVVMMHLDRSDEAIKAQLIDKDPTVKAMAMVMKHLDRSDQAIEAIRSFLQLCSREGSLHNIAIELLKYNFEGRYDLVRFMKTVQKAGLYAHLRIGPYVCTEWNYGGFPVWLKYVPGISFRKDNEPFKVGAPARVGLVAPTDVVVPPGNTGLDPSQTSFFQRAMEGFTKKIVDLMKSNNLFASQGGPIILSQIENEFGKIQRQKGYHSVSWAAIPPFAKISRFPLVPPLFPPTLPTTTLTPLRKSVKFSRRTDYPKLSNVKKAKDKVRVILDTKRRPPQRPISLVDKVILLLAGAGSILILVLER